MTASVSLLTQLLCLQHCNLSFFVIIMQAATATKEWTEQETLLLLEVLSHVHEMLACELLPTDIEHHRFRELFFFCLCGIVNPLEDFSG